MKNFLVVVTLLLCAVAGAESISTVYTIDASGQVQLKGWDSESTGPEILKHVDVSEEVGVRIYRGAALVEAAEDTATLTLGVVPGEASHILVSGRSGPSNNVFPHLLIELVSPDQTTILYDAVWASMVREERAYPLPEEFKGKNVSLRFRIKNQRYGDDYRIFYLHHASIARIPAKAGTWRPAIEL